MVNSKVIDMSDVFNGGGMAARIAQAKEKAEADYQEKVKQSREADVDVRDFFSDEELDRILTDNEFFNGRVADLSKVQRHEKVSMAARWMKAHSMEVVDIDIEPVSSSHPNAIITMEIRRLASLRGQELKVFTAMCAMADSVFMSGSKDSIIRFTFGIEGVWNE